LQAFVSAQLSFIALGMAALAVLGEGPSWFLFWPAFSFGAATIAYSRRRPDLFGKQRNGRLSWARLVALLPYLGLTWATWWLARALDRRPPCAMLTESLYIGRRPLPAEVPPGVRSILDLTCELSEDPEVMRDRVYLLRPILDATAMSAGELVALVAELQRLPPPVYVHCAQGHGRTGMVAAAFLIATGRALTVEDALTHVWAVRPAARPNKAQVRALQLLHSTLLDAAVSGR
jgi:hypothetical protein